MTRLLSVPALYEAFQKTLRPRRMYAHIKDRYLPPNAATVLDLGCGTGQLYPSVAPAKYTGVDLDPSYIERARRRFDATPEFVCASATDLDFLGDRRFDAIFAVGLLHHLDDAQVARVLQHARRHLAPHGTFVAVDGVRLERQSAIGRLLLSLDRGRHVREFDDHIALIRKFMTVRSTEVRHDLLRVPYSLVFVEAGIE